MLPGAVDEPVEVLPAEDADHEALHGAVADEPQVPRRERAGERLLERREALPHRPPPRGDEGRAQALHGGLDAGAVEPRREPDREPREIGTPRARSSESAA